MDQSRLLVAVVDDEEPVRKALRRLFRAADLDVAVFGSGRDFLDSLKARLPDCVVLDLHLPGLTGFDVLQDLRQSGSPLPVVVITGKDEPETREKALASGATAYLVKPVDGQALLAAIVSTVRGAGGGAAKGGTEPGKEKRPATR
jgi:DNA-binding response OmpR family regulator